MLIRFSSIATGPITMFGDDALQLINMLGASGAIPGAISEEDISGALQRLRQQLECAATSTVPADKRDEEGDDADHEPPMILASRAAPLIEILERAAKDKAPVMWERA